MSDPAAFPISVSLALDALSEASSEVRALETRLADSKAARNRLIRDAAGKVKASVLQDITGLSREQIYRIQTSPEQPTRTGV